MSAILRVEGVSRSYGSFRALTDVSFEVDENEVLAIIGPNGAGKSTLFKVMTGEVLASAGATYLMGRDISLVPAEQRVHLGIGRTFQVARVFLESSALDNVIVALEARIRTQGRRSFRKVAPSEGVMREACAWLDELGLGALKQVEARHLSLGDRKRLELALTLATGPSLLMLDEPTAGMSPTERKGVIKLITRLKAALGLTIVLTEHDMEFVFNLSQRVMVLNQGRVVLIGTPNEIRASELVQDIYLGRRVADADP